MSHRLNDDTTATLIKCLWTLPGIYHDIIEEIVKYKLENDIWRIWTCWHGIEWKKYDGKLHCRVEWTCGTVREWVHGKSNMENYCDDYWNCNECVQCDCGLRTVWI